MQRLLKDIGHISMKPPVSIYAFGLLLVFFNSCGKNNSIQNPLYNNSIIGEWELHHIEGVQLANANPNFPPGNGNTWKFSNSGFEYYVNGQLKDSGSYSVTSGTQQCSGQTMALLKLNGSNTDVYFFTISLNILFIYHGCIASDGYIEDYIRK